MCRCAHSLDGARWIPSARGQSLMRVTRRSFLAASASATAYAGYLALPLGLRRPASGRPRIWPASFYAVVHAGWSLDVPTSSGHVAGSASVPSVPVARSRADFGSTVVVTAAGGWSGSPSHMVRAAWGRGRRPASYVAPVGRSWSRSRRSLALYPSRHRAGRRPAVQRRAARACRSGHLMSRPGWPRGCSWARRRRGSATFSTRARVHPRRRRPGPCRGAGVSFSWLRSSRDRGSASSVLDTDLSHCRRGEIATFASKAMVDGGNLSFVVHLDQAIAAGDSVEFILLPTTQTSPSSSPPAVVISSSAPVLASSPQRTTGDTTISKRVWSKTNG